MIGAATADVAAQQVFELVERRVGMLIEHGSRRHHESGCAEAALQPVMPDETGDDFVHFVAVLQRLDRLNSLAATLDRKD